METLVGPLKSGDTALAQAYEQLFQQAQTRLLPITHTILREAARVTRHKVLVSFHHPLSFTYLRKLCQRILSGRSRGAGVVSHWRLKREAQQCGLRMVDTRSFKKYASINWFACLEKTAP